MDLDLDGEDLSEGEYTMIMSEGLQEKNVGEVTDEMYKDKCGEG